MFSPSVEISLETCKTTNPSCLSVETSKWHFKDQTFQWRNRCGPCQDFCLFFPERHVRIALPLMTAYHWPRVTSSWQQKPVQFSSHSRVPTWVLPVPAVEKHPLLGQEHPALLDRPGRADSRAGCECEERTINSTIVMGLAHSQGTWSSLAGCWGIHLYLLLDYRRNAKPYYSLPTLDVSTKCTLGDWFLRNVTLDLW